MALATRSVSIHDELAELKHEIQAELGRGEAKAAVVVTASGILLSALATAALLARAPGPVIAVVVGAGVADAASTTVALLAVRPHLGRKTTGWLRMARLRGLRLCSGWRRPAASSG
jgi:hypothetical protein